MRCEEIRSLLSAYLDGELEPVELQAVEGHLPDCSRCRDELELLRGTVGLVRSLPEEELPEGFSERLRHHLAGKKPWRHGILSALRPDRVMRYRGWMAAAAVFLILLAAGVFSDSLEFKQSKTVQPPLGPAQGTGPDVGGESKAGGQFNLGMEEAAPEGSTVERYRDQLRAKSVPKVAAPAAAEKPYQPDYQRKLTTRAELAVELKDVREAYQGVVSLVEGAQGYVEKSSFSRETTGKYSASLTVRVPRVAFARVLEQVRALGVVQRDVIKGEEVTGQYVDLEARRQAVEMQESRLLSLLGRAGSLGDVLALERELARVRSEVEGLTGQMKYLDNLSSLSTIQVELFEPGEETAAGSVWRRAWQGFLDTSRSLVGPVKEAIVLAGRALPVLLLLAGAWLGYRYRRRSAARQAAPSPPPGTE